MKSDFSVSKTIKLPVSDWKIKFGDKPEYASLSYDDSEWENVKINESLPHQGFKKRGFCWYRLRFTLPAGFASKNLLLDMGFISSFDETYVNGILVGSYGSLPPAKPVLGSSWANRKYYIPRSQALFKTGKNLIAVKVYVGYLGGMFKGFPSLSILDGTFLKGSKLKGKGEDSLAIYLSDFTHLNHYTTGTSISIAPEYAYISSGKPSLNAVFHLKITNEAKHILQEIKIPCELKSYQWISFSPMKINASKPGKYICECFLESDGKPIFENKIPFSIAPAKIFRIPVDRNIAWKDQKHQTLKNSFGHTGPRLIKNNELVNIPGGADARGALTFSVLCSEKEDSPLIFMNNVRPSHKNLEKPRYFLAFDGSEYDTFTDAWLLGCVSVGKSKKKSLEITSSSWTERCWKYMFSDNSIMNFSINELSPAWRLNTDASSVNLFDGIKKYGAGLPSHMAFIAADGKVKVVTAKESFNGSHMGANWILVWFNGSKGWNEFDIPWLFSLQKKPESVSIGPDSLNIRFSGSAGYLCGMPLFGVKLLPPSETASWSNFLPENATKKCQLWSGILANAPQSVVRSFAIDYRKDSIFLHDKFTYFPIRDEWDTKPLPIAPLPPALILSADSGNIPVTVNKENTDFSLPTLHGPYVAVRNTDEYLVSIGSLVHFTNEVRTVEPASDKETAKLQKELIKIISDHMRYMNTHPWNELFWHGRYVPGNVENPAMANLIQAVPYLPEDLMEKVSGEVGIEVEDYYLREGKPDDILNTKLMKQAKNADLTFTVKSLSGKEMTSFTPRQNSAAIDSPCVESFRLYVIWLYAHTLHHYDFIKNNWEKLKRFYNLIPNSHDWATCVSWDTFSGIRVGNGLQESGLMHAGAAAMARMAYHRKELNLRDEAVYFSIMQLVGMQAALNANTYLRENRPWPSTHTESDEMEFVEKTRPIHYAEFNEFGGFSQNIIFGYTFINNTSSFILTPLPETMRPYKEIWTAETDDFFDPAMRNPSGLNVNPISVDMYLYMTTRYPESFEKVFSERRKIAKSLNWHQQLSDIRAAIDYYGKITYKKLWTE